MSDDTEPLLLTSPSFAASLLCLSAAVGVELPKSNDVPGVRGVFPELPKDAKAPEPSPKADEAPLVGEATVDVVRGAMPLKGLLLLLKDPSPPNRLAGWYGRVLSDLPFSFGAALDSCAADASLLELLRAD